MAADASANDQLVPPAPRPTGNGAADIIGLAGWADATHRLLQVQGGLNAVASRQAQGAVKADADGRKAKAGHLQRVDAAGYDTSTPTGVAAAFADVAAKVNAVLALLQGDFE